MIHAKPLSNGFDPAMRKGTLTQCEPQIPSHMCKFQVRLLLLWHKAFPGSSLSTVKGTGPENYIFKGCWVSLESSIMPVFSAEPKLFLTEFGTDHALDSFKSIFFPQQNDTHLSAVFRRKWDTCDPYDMVLGDDTVRVIWGYHPNKRPSSPMR